jgi:large subunit ribosomal protein L4
MKVAALRGALSDRASNGRVAVVTEFVTGDLPRTADALAVLLAATGSTGSRVGRPVLVVVQEGDRVTWRSLRNVPGVRVLSGDQLNTYDVLASDHVVFTQAALAAFVSRSGGELAEVPSSKPAGKAAAKSAGTGASERAGTSAAGTRSTRAKRPAAARTSAAEQEQSATPAEQGQPAAAEEQEQQEDNE